MWKILTRAIKKCLCHFRVRQIFKAENLNLNLKIKKKPTKFSSTPTFSLLKRWPYKYWRLPRKKIDGLLNSNGGFLILFLMWNTLKSVYYVKIHPFWMVRSNLRGHNHDMWRNIYMPLLFNVFGAAKMPLRRIFPIDATKTDIKFEIPTIENPRINILHNSFGMRHSPLTCSPPWSHI